MLLTINLFTRTKSVKNLSRYQDSMFLCEYSRSFVRGRIGQKTRGRSCNVTMVTPDTRDQG